MFVVAVSSVFAQGGVPGGFPPQSALYNDALLLARALPFVALIGIVVGIWLGKTSMRQPKSAPDSPVVIRHDIGAVLAHWSNGVGMMIGMITGAIVLRWVARPDEMRLIFAIHYVGSGLIVFAIAAHLTQNAVTGGMGLIPRSLKDAGEALGNLVEYTGLFGPDGAVANINLPKGLRKPFAEILASFGIAPPKRQGKFLPAEKLFSYVPWLVIIAVMTVTGLIKAFRYLYPLSPDFIAQVSAIHDLFTVVSIVMLGIHLAALFLAPSHWPLVGSMFTTRVKRSYVERHHPEWLRQLQAEEKQPAAAASVDVNAKPSQAKV
jgi:cytochrome b subunit of formate dehydrogenase